MFTTTKRHSLKYSMFFLLFVSISIVQTSAQSNESDMNNLYTKLYSYMYTNKDSTYFYSNKIFKKSIDTKEYSNLLFPLIFANKSAAYFNDYNQIKNNIKQLDSIYNKHKTGIDSLPDVDYIKNSILYDKGLYYYKMDNYKLSQESFQSIIKATESLPDSIIKNADDDLVYGAFAHIAKMYSNDGKYDLAREYYNKNIRFINIKDPNNLAKINRIYSLIGEVYKRENNPRRSNLFFIRSLKHSLNSNGNVNSITTEANNIVENYLSLSQLDSAEYYLQIIKPFVGINNPYSNLYFTSQAKLCLAKKQIPQAVEYYKEGLELTKKKWGEHKSYQIADIYQNLSNLYKNKNDLKTAIKYNDLAIDQVSGFGVVNSSINNVSLLKLLKQKSELLNLIASYSNTISNTNNASLILDSLKPSFKSDADKLLLIENAFPLFESGLDATFNLFQNTLDKTYIEKAFHYTEKSKSVLLLETLLSAKATKYASIPKEIIESEQLLKVKITDLEKQLNGSKSSDLEDLLFKIKSNYRNLVEEIETNYKNYYDLKYNTEVISISETQKLLKTNDVLISYFYGNKFIYCISITKNSEHLKRIPVTKDLENILIAYQKEIGNPKSNIKTLSKQSYKIYKTLLEPGLGNTSARNLIIIPDGLLNYIPFESLITTEKNNYLIENRTVSYVNSATLLSQLKKKKENNHQILAFAPTFKGINNTLLPLPNNKKEAKNTLNYFKGKLFLNAEASLQNFNIASPNYSIIHLATHAIYNDETPEFSFLAFTSNNENENLLYVKDLYNLKLNADLVTLSACESGIGDLKRGEGLMSLARGFYFSGASSISSTLWKINDASASKLMDDFYLNLSKGLPKQKALQLAKLNFINKNRGNALVHPYYWSGFIISGNTDPIVSNHQWIWYILGALALMIFIILFRKKRSKAIH